MKVFYVALLAISVTICSSTNSTCDMWWSLGIHGISQSQEVTPVNCSLLSLTAIQLQLCESYLSRIRTMAVGIRKGIVQCQEQFVDARWNCTTFEGDHLFGALVAQETREIAVVNALLAATASVEVAIACREEKLAGCTCQPSGVPAEDSEGNFIIYDCAHDMETSNNMISSALECNVGNELGDRIRQHNIDAGLEIAKETTETCRCTGYSGACTVQSCYSKSLELEVIGAKIRTLYEFAVKVILGNDSIVPEHSQGSIIREEDLVYENTSPDFCTADQENGIPGVSGRLCENSPSSPKSCQVLCCNRGAYRVTMRRPIEECNFVWCCEIVCTITGYTDIELYYCN